MSQIPFGKEVIHKKQKLELITKKSLGEGFEVFSMDCFPEIFAVYLGKILDDI